MVEVEEDQKEHQEEHRVRWAESSSSSLTRSSTSETSCSEEQSKKTASNTSISNIESLEDEKSEKSESEEINGKLLYTDAELIKKANTGFALPPVRFFHSSVPCMHQSHYKWLAEPKRHLPYAFTNAQEQWQPFKLPWSPYQHPLYRTSNNVYGAVPTRLPLISSTFHGLRPNFSMSYRKVENIHDRRCGMYKNFGFSSALDSSNVYDDPRL